MLLLSSADFFSKFTFSKNSFRNTTRVPNGWDPDQDQHSVGPDLGLTCLQKLLLARIELTLNAPIATKIVCCSRLLKCLRSLYGKQCGPRSDCSYRSSLFWVHPVCFYSDSFTIFCLWVLGLAVSNINESQLQTYESKTLFLMTSLQYYCIPGHAEIKTYAQKMQDGRVKKSLLLYLIRQQCKAIICSRRLQQTTFSDTFFSWRFKVTCLQLSPYIDIGALFRHSG